MLNFDFFNHRAEVRRALSSRLNHHCMDTLRHQDRKTERSYCTEVVWLIPTNGRRADYSRAEPAISKDLSIQGMALIHNRPVSESPVIVGFPGEHGISFFQCNLEHCSHLGYGFYQIGLCPVKLLSPNQAERNAWETRQRNFRMPKKCLNQAANFPWLRLFSGVPSIGGAFSRLSRRRNRDARRTLELTCRLGFAPPDRDARGADTGAEAVFRGWW